MTRVRGFHPGDAITGVPWAALAAVLLLSGCTSPLLVGMALDRGYLSDASDPVTAYLPELRDRDPRYDSTRYAPDCVPDALGDRGGCYRRAWWLSPPERGIGPAVGAWGHLGQLIYVFPEQDLVVVRFGRKLGGVSWPAVFREIARAVQVADGEVADR